MAGEDKAVITTISGLDAKTDIGGRKDPGNILVRNTGTIPVVNFAFMLRVEGVFDLPCKSITGISRENEFDYIQEGGLNDYVHLKRKAISQPFKFQVERYVGVNWVDPLPLGTELVLPVILFVNKHGFPGLEPVRTYAFTGCTVIAKDYGEMNAEASGLLVEKVTIAYREMVCLDIPSETLEDETWAFDGKKREGKGERHYNSNLFNDAWEKTYNSKQKMEERAKHYKFAQASSERTPQMAKHISVSKELTPAQMEAKINKWKLEKDKDGHLIGEYGKDYERMVSDYNKMIDKEIQNAKTPEEKKAAEAKKIAMKGSASRKYTHSATAQREGSATYNKTEYTKEQMVEKAEKWKLEKDKDGHLIGEFGKDYERMVSDYNEMIDKEIKNAKTPEEKTAAEAKKIAMKGSASRKYTHSATAQREGSATYNKTEYTKQQMEAKINKWKLEKDKDGQLIGEYGKDYERMVSDYNEMIDKEIQNAKTPEEKTAAEAKKIAMKGSASRKYTHSATAQREGSATYNKAEYTKQQMEERAKLYKLSEDTPKKYSSAKHHEEELSKTAMEDKAKAFKLSKDTPKKYSSAKHHEKELSKTAMADKAQTFKPSKDTPKKYSSAKHHEKELSKTAMADKARLWPRKKSAKQITDFLKNRTPMR